MQLVQLTYANVTLEQSTTVPNSQDQYCFEVTQAQREEVQNALKNDELLIFKALDEFYPVFSYEDNTTNQKQTIGGWFILAAAVISLAFSTYMFKIEK